MHVSNSNRNAMLAELLQRSSQTLQTANARGVVGKGGNAFAFTSASTLHADGFHGSRDITAGRSGRGQGGAARAAQARLAVSLCAGLRFATALFLAVVRSGLDGGPDRRRHRGS